MNYVKKAQHDRNGHIYTFFSISGIEVTLSVFNGKIMAITGDCVFASDIGDLTLQCVCTLESVVFQISFGSIASITISETTFLATEFNDIPAVIDERYRNTRFDESKKSVKYITNPLLKFHEADEKFHKIFEDSEI